MPDDDPVRPIRLVTEMIADLTELISSRESLQSVVEATREIQPAGGIRGFASRVAKSSDFDATTVLNMLHTLANIRRMQRAREVNAEHMVAVLTASLEKYAPDTWKTEYLETWLEACPDIIRAIESVDEDHPLYVSEKAETLAYSHQNIVSSQRIVTDVRPVFNKDGAEIQEMIILHMLLVEYTDGISPPKRIALTLDSGDIQRLGELCERAKSKAHTTMKLLKEFNPVELPEDLRERSGP